jgi:tRNA A37 methylthiotransferase MiaB
MPGQVPANIVKQRAVLLRNIAAEKKAGFLSRQVGRNLQVLVQGFDETAQICSGISRNYVLSKFRGNKEIINSEQIVKIDRVIGEHVTGDWVN